MTTSTNDQTTITTITNAIRNATSSRGDLLNLCRENARTEKGRKLIAQACNIILEEKRETQAIAKGFKSTAKSSASAVYLADLDARITAGTAGAKNERTNFLSWKCGHLTNKVAFYHVVQVALARQTEDTKYTNCSKLGYTAVLNVDTDFKICIEEQKEKVISENEKRELKNKKKAKQKEQKEFQAFKKAKKEGTTQTGLSSAISALEALNDTDLNTLASAMLHGSNSALVKLAKAIILLKSQESANKQKVNDISGKLTELEILAAKQAVDLKLAKDKKMGLQTIRNRTTKLKLTNTEIAALKNTAKSEMSLESTAY